MLFAFTIIFISIIMISDQTFQPKVKVSYSTTFKVQIFMKH